MKLLILNGPNLNMLGIREPDKYGTESYATLCERVRDYCDGVGVDTEFYQSNHEGDLVDAIQKAYFDGISGIVFNPAAYTHTSVALLDALLATKIPCVEVHISRIEEREDFRQISYVRQAALATISGLGIDGYVEGCRILIKRLTENENTN